MKRLRWAHIFPVVLLPVAAQAVGRLTTAPAGWLSLAGELLAFPVIAVAAVGVGRLFLPTWRAAAAAVSALFLLLFVYGLRTNLLLIWPALIAIVTHWVAVPVWIAIAALLVGAAWMLRHRLRLAEVERVLWLIGIGGLIGALHAWHRADTFIPTLHDEPAPVQAPSAPRDVYYLILDSYPSFEVLRDEYGFVDPTLEQTLRDDGFQTVRGAHSNYAFTYLSMAASLNMNLLSDLGATGATDAGFNAPAALIQHNALMRSLTARGYHVAHIGSIMEPAPDVQVRDFPLVNRSLGAFLSATPLDAIGLFTWETWDARYRVTRELQALRDIAATPGPKFVYLHVLCPHPPLAFGAHGEWVSPWNAARNRRAAFLGQLAYVNSQLPAILNTLLNSGQRKPIIVIQGDHGSEYIFGRGLDVPGLATPRFKSAQMEILNSYYFPPEMNVKVDDAITPVNSFRVVLNALFGETRPMVENRSFFSVHARPYEFEEMTGRWDTPPLASHVAGAGAPPNSSR